jgi:aminopeptidase N
MYERWRSDPALPESWVEEALEPFNAPEHAADTAPLLAPALAALPELKRTRKIFFVERWLAAFLGGQADAAALEDVRRLLQGNLDDDLRLKVLQAADGLERAVRIRERYAAAR